jgi:3-dehydroquinate synthase
MRTITVPLKERSYNILIQKGLLSQVEDYLSTEKDYIIITDQNIPKKYIEQLTTKLNVLKVYVETPGESLKCAEKAFTLIEDMLDNSFPKSITIIALGGGVIGDFAGFIASIYMRGVPFVQIPTSLLAQIDSSVGGKVAINSKNMKNAIGNFYQPTIVLIDPETLETLEPRHFNNGMAELIKHGIIDGNPLFEDLLNDSINGNIEDFIERSVRIKTSYVVKDELDNGLRQILNYGHTIGHALEQYSNYSLLHGEAIAIGMTLMSKGTSYESHLRNIFEKYDLPTSYEYNPDDLLKYIVTDKKVKKEKLNLIVIETPGNPLIKPIIINEIRKYL